MLQLLSALSSLMIHIVNKSPDLYHTKHSIETGTCCSDSVTVLSYVTVEGIARGSSLCAAQRFTIDYHKKVT
jgi:hypothetical protein